MKVTTGVFHDADRVTDAVRSLLGRSVPADEISVVIQDPGGGRHDVPVDAEAGTLKGAAIGGSVGGALGALGVTLATTGAAVAPGVGLLAAGPLLAALRGAMVGAVAGVPLGGVIGMGRWTAKPHLDPAELECGAALVAVHSDEMADVARAALEEAGADEVRVERDAGT